MLRYPSTFVPSGSRRWGTPPESPERRLVGAPRRVSGPDRLNSTASCSVVQTRPAHQKPTGGRELRVPPTDLVPQRGANGTLPHCHRGEGMDGTTEGERVCPSGHRVESGDQFCGQCGTPVAPVQDVICPSGHPVAEDAQYCGACGLPLRPQGEPMQSEPTPVCPNGHPLVRGARFCGECGVDVPSPVGLRGPTLAQYGAARVSTLTHDFATLPYGTLLPLKSFWKDKAWRQGWTGLFGLAAVAPFVLLHLVGTTQGIGPLAWGFSLYFAMIWFIAIRTLVEPDPIPWQVVVPISVFTIVAGVTIAVTLERHLGATGQGWLHNILTIGFPEELAKALPVFLFAFLPRRQFSAKTYLFLGVISGLAFGAAEAVSYSSLYSELLPQVSSATPLIGDEVWRLISDSLLHACMSGIACYFIGIAANQRKRAVPFIAIGLGVAAILHGTYDTFAANWLGVVLACIIVFVFIGYVSAGDAIVEHLGNRPPHQSREAVEGSSRQWSDTNVRVREPIAPRDQRGVHRRLR